MDQDLHAGDQVSSPMCGYVIFDLVNSIFRYFKMFKFSVAVWLCLGTKTTWLTFGVTQDTNSDDYSKNKVIPV